MSDLPPPNLPRSAADSHNPWLIAIVVSMATFMEVLDTSIANVSLQHMAGSLAASQDEATWVLTSYLVSNAVILPISGWLSTVIGRKRFYMSCVALFGISSLMCGLSTSLGELVFFRVLQGMGGGGLAPSEQSILADSFPEEQRGQAFALYGIAVVVAPTLGPTLGGWITDNYSWHWIFLINLPVCAASLALCGWLVHDPPVIRKERCEAVKHGVRVDFLGFGLVAVGLGFLQVVLDRGQEEDWFHSTPILIFTIISVICLIALVIWELIYKDPIVDIPLFKFGNFAMASTVMFIFGFILISSTQLLPQFDQEILGYNATTAGLSLTAGGFATLCVIPFVGRLIRFVQARYLVTIGMAIEAAAAYHLSGLTTGVSFSHVAWARVFQAVGLPFLFVPITTVSYAGLPPEKSANASALINVMRNLGGSFGISFGITMLARRSQFHHGRLVEGLTPFASATHGHVAQSLGGLQELVNVQSRVFSYIEVFWILSIIAVFALPVTLMLKKVQPGAAAAH